jgi:hypothetical protein
MRAFGDAQRLPHEVRLEVGDRVHEPVPDRDRLPDSRGVGADVHVGAREQLGAEAEPRGRVVVARDQDDRRELAQPRERLVGEPHRLHRRQRAIVEVARDEHRVDAPLARQRDEEIDERSLRAQQVLAVEGASEVPVGGVEQAHRRSTIARAPDGSPAVRAEGSADGRSSEASVR